MKRNDKIRRGREITTGYLSLLDKHIDDVVNGDAAKLMELNEIAAALYVSHQHLSDTIKQEMGHHPCHFYDLKIIGKAKQLLQETDLPVSQVAYMLTYDPSNFSKFFKKFTGETPHQWRENNPAR